MPTFNPDGLKNVAALAVGITQQGDEGGPIRIVLDRFDLRGNAGLVALEIDDAIVLLVAASTMPDRDLAVIVAPVDAILRFQEWLVRLVRRQLLLVIQHRLETKRVGLRPETLDSH